VNDRRAWLDEWCPVCRAAPGTRCRHESLKTRRDPAPSIHVARGWRNRSCPTCRAMPEEMCRTPSGREASRPHAARLRRARGELLHDDVWEKLDRRGATIAVVPFSGRAGAGGRVDTIDLSRLEGEKLVDVERSTARDELTCALEGPIWDRYGVFAGQPPIRGTLTWVLGLRSIVIAGRRGGEAFEEVVA
jgi:hypothetical protein